jgi:GDP-L-fucose synthase
LKPTDRIYIAGHTGMVGSALVRTWQQAGYNDIITRTSTELDLTNQQAVAQFFEQEKPDYVLMAAAKVGGIEANRMALADFFYQNTMMATNTIHQSWKHGVKKLLFLGSSCVYPKFASQPIHESELLQGMLEPTNEAYALAKIAGVKMCSYYRKQFGCNFIAAMPCNLYGYGDRYDAQLSHVIPAMILKMHKAKQEGAKEVTLWGTGTPLREFLFVDDLASACLLLMHSYNDDEWINIGSGTEIAIKDLALMVQHAVGFTGTVTFDPNMPDGTPRKVLDTKKLRALGWEPQVLLSDGLAKTYIDFTTRFTSINH